LKEDEVYEQLVKGVECSVRFGGDLCTSKIVNVVRAIEAQRAEHKGDRGCSALAHHCGVAKTKARCDVKVEETIVAET